MGIVTAMAQPSQLSRTVNFRNNYIPIEIQNGFVLDSVAYIHPVSQSVHFKYNSGGQMIWEDDLGALVLSSIDSSSHRVVNVSYQLFSDNSYNEKGLLSLQNVHYYADSVLQNYYSIVYSYDGDNRIQSKIYPASNGDTAISNTYQYDSSGNLTSYYWHRHNPDMVDSSIMEYDSLGRLKSRLDSKNDSPNGYFYNYDSTGNVFCTIVDFNDLPTDTMQIHQFRYDGSGRELLDIYWPGDTSYYEKVVSTYDGSGKILSIIDSSYHSGTWAWPPPYNFSYNSDNNLDSCVTGEEENNYCQPKGILLYDNYGNAFFEGFDNGYRFYKIFPYYSKLSALGVTNSISTPRDFYLSQNYPNPFNPTTVINYQLPVTGDVTLKVYDVLGREVRTLVDGRQTAGSHSIGFSADKLPSGVYFYSITAGAFHQVRKMVLMK
jgi:antitoxin component YwqK of YwqJK toxin-antitoxin module